ncbi:MAG: glycosyltransferase, partial [Dehalococcoidia bacterium]
SSSLLRHARIELIPNGIDVCRYKQENRFQARQILKLPHDKKLLLYGALSYDRDQNKGFEYLKTAVDLLRVRGWKEKAEIIVFGAANQENTREFGLKIHSLGRIDDEQRLVSLYSAVDVFVYPSVQENLPNMVMEAMSCGTPCVTFNVGGIPDMIEHQLNGYLARPYDASDIADGIAWVLSDADRIRVLSNRARQKIEQEFNLESVAKRYRNLYDSLLARQE